MRWRMTRPEPTPANAVRCFDRFEQMVREIADAVALLPDGAMRSRLRALIPGVPIPSAKEVLLGTRRDTAHAVPSPGAAEIPLAGDHQAAATAAARVDAIQRGAIGAAAGGSRRDSEEDLRNAPPASPGSAASAERGGDEPLAAPPHPAAPTGSSSIGDFLRGMVP